MLCNIADFQVLRQLIVDCNGWVGWVVWVPALAEYIVLCSWASHLHVTLTVSPSTQVIGKNNRFPFLDILGYLKNTHKNPKFDKVRKVPIREPGWEFPGWDLSHFAKFGIFMGIL